jgi:hypothetical protein
MSVNALWYPKSGGEADDRTCVCQERKIRAVVEPTMWNFFIQDRDL